jgi:hypothetical protein
LQDDPGRNLRPGRNGVTATIEETVERLIDTGHILYLLNEHDDAEEAVNTLLLEVADALDHDLSITVENQIAEVVYALAETGEPKPTRPVSPLMQQLREEVAREHAAAPTLCEQLGLTDEDLHEERPAPSWRDTLPGIAEEIAANPGPPVLAEALTEIVQETRPPSAPTWASSIGLDRAQVLREIA